MQKREFFYLSGDQRTKIHTWEWKPEQEPIVGVLQIVHGMVEFVERYAEFAEFLTENGFVGVGHDNLGHGSSIVDNDEI